MFGEEYCVIEEGLNSRIIVLDDFYDILKNGKKYLILCIKFYYLLDLVIIMFGFNDMKERYYVLVCDIVKGVGIFVKMVFDIIVEKSLINILVKVLLVFFLYIGKIIIDFNCGEEFGYMRLYELLWKLVFKYEEVVKNLGIEFIDVVLIIELLEIDVLYFLLEGYRVFGEVFVKCFIEILVDE